MNNFVGSVLKGKASILDLDVWIDKWHNSDSSLELHEYLGLTWDDYCIIATKPSKLKDIIKGEN